MNEIILGLIITVSNIFFLMLGITIGVYFEATDWKPMTFRKKDK